MSLTAAALSAARGQWRRRWYDEGWYGSDHLAAVVDRVLAGQPHVELTFDRAGERIVVSLGALAARAAAVEAGLDRLGLGPGERVCVQLPHGPESMALLVAALRRGLVTVPVPTAAGDRDLAAVLAGSAARLLVLPDAWRGRTAGERLGALGHVPTLDHVVVAGPDAPRGSGFDRLEVTGGPAPAPVSRSADDAVTLLFTSGSTGAPKGVQHSSNSLLAELRTGWAVLSGEPRRRPFVPNPPGHVAGVLSALMPLVTGRPAAYLDPWDAGRALDLIDATGSTLMGGVPFFLVGLLEAAVARGRGTGTLRYANVGGAGVPPVLIERAEALGLRAARAYGLTEHPTVSNGAADDPLAVRALSDGRVAAGSRVRIVDPAGRDVGPGAEGEIVTVGPDMMIGYTDPAADLAAHLPGGWFRTGDLGRLDGDVLTVTGRSKDLVIRGGVNIAVGDIEAVLARHPAVGDVAVVGVPDERLGERLLAVVVPAPGPARGPDLDLAEVRRHCGAAGLSRITTPEHLWVLDALPRGPTGKVQRAELTRRWERGARAARG